MLTLNLCKNDAGRGMILYIDSCVKYSPINRDNDFQEYICVEFSLKNKDKLLLASSKVLSNRKYFGLTSDTAITLVFFCK
jgi:hypothetical protein